MPGDTVGMAGGDDGLNVAIPLVMVSEDVVQPSLQMANGDGHVHGEQAKSLRK